MKKQTTRRALLLSVLSLLLCVSMLVGSTFAWFTDSVVSANNKIVAGNLKLDLELLDNGTWTSIKESTAPIFDYDLWEPGYTDVKILKVENEGSLALKWKAMFRTSAEELEPLANVIDVYVKPGQSEYPADRTDLTGWEKVGTVAEFISTLSETTCGELTPMGTEGATAYLGIALKMQETAGNEYQDASITPFDILVLATQLTYEKDSFDELYDEDATYDEYLANEKVTYVANLEEFKTALTNQKDGDIIAFSADIAGDVVIDQPTGKEVNLVIDGRNFKYDGSMVINGHSTSEHNDTLVIKNVNFITDDAGRYIIESSDTSSGSVERYAHNVTIENCTFTASGAGVHSASSMFFQQAYNILVKDCTATNMHSLLLAESCGSTVKVVDSKVVNGKNGVSFNNTLDAVIEGTVIESVADGGYGIRHKGQQPNYKLTVDGCTVSAFVPVLVRNMTGTGYSATFTGTNTFTATNTFGYQVVVSAGDWDNDAAQPSKPTGSFTLTGVEGLNVFKG